MPAALELRRPMTGGVVTCYAGGARAHEADDRRRCDPRGRPVAARAGDSRRGRVVRGRPAGGQRRRRRHSTWEGKKIRVSKLENIINNFEIIKIQNVLCHRGYWIDWWAVMLSVAYTMYITAINISVGYTLSVRHRCMSIAMAYTLYATGQFVSVA
jgi:hypothetical protein